MRIKIKSLAQITEDMRHTNINDLHGYTCGLSERFLSLICGQWFDVRGRRLSNRYPQHYGSQIRINDLSEVSWFIIDYLVEEIEEDED